MRKIGIILGDPGCYIVETEAYYAYAEEGPDGKLSLDDRPVFLKSEHGYNSDFFLAKLGKWDPYVFPILEENKRSI